VQDWIARFGGRGVRVGAAYPTSRSPQDLEDFGSNRMADADGVVSPPRPMRRQPDASAASAAAPAPQPAAQASEPVAIEPPAVEPAAPVVAPSAPAGPARSERAPVNMRKQKPVRPQRKPAPAPAAQAARTPVPAQAAPAAPTPAPAQAPAVARTPADVHLPVHAKSPALSGALVALVVVAGIVAIGIGQRRAIGQLATQALAQPTAQQPTTVVAPPPPAPAVPSAPPSQYSIAVGSYATRDMASAECDYLSRLVPMHVRVAPGNTDGFRLLLGRFDERSKAELATRRLQDQGLIPDAKVIAVSPLPASTDSGAAPGARVNKRRRR
jgi:hypothetical protein